MTPAIFTTKPRFEKIQIVNFIKNKLPKQPRRKEFLHENNTEVPEVSEEFTQTRLGGKVWACDAIMQKTY